MSAKIVVVHMKDIIKRGIFIVIGIAIVIAILLFITSKSSETEYIPGTYSAEIILHNSPVVIEVTVDDSRILDIAMLNMGETQEVFYPLFEPAFETLRDEILEKQTTEVDTGDAAVTSSILIDAVNKALNDAKRDGKDAAETTSAAIS